MTTDINEAVINEAVNFVNYHHYSKPMDCVNIGDHQFPIKLSLKKLTIKDEKNQAKYTFYIRYSHGILHALAAMELIEPIHEQYKKHVSDYENAIVAIAKHFKIGVPELLDLVKIAALFHDAGRKGDGKDLWDEESANVCKAFLKSKYPENSSLPQFIADTIRYKDNAEGFLEQYKYINEHVDFVRQLLNTADTIEVMRVRSDFFFKYMPIRQYLEPDACEPCIEELVIPHRQRILDEGRLAKKGKIICDNYKDPYVYQNRTIRPGKNSDSAAQAYIKAAKKYKFSILDTTADVNLTIQRAIRGIETYQKRYKNCQIQFFHHGFFAPRYHGKRGVNRANYFLKELQSKISTKAKIMRLYALFANNDGITLQEEVMRSFGQYNKKTIISQLKTHLKPMHEDNKSLNDKIGQFVQISNGVKSEDQRIDPSHFHPN